MPEQVVVVEEKRGIVPADYGDIIYEPTLVVNPDGNPLLEMFNATHKMFPPFADVTAEHVSPAMELVIEASLKDFKQLEEKVAQLGDKVTFAQLFHSGELQFYRFFHVWGLVSSTLTSVKDSEALRQEVAKWQPKAIEFFMLHGQSKVFHNAKMSLMKKHNDGSEILEPNKVRAVRLSLKESQQSGLALEGNKKDEFNNNEKELGELSRQYNANVKDATEAFLLVISDVSDMDGIPESLLSQFAQNAVDKKVDENATKEKGPWAIKLDKSNVFGVLKYSKHRWLREKMLRADDARASSFERVQSKDMSPRTIGPLVSDIKETDSSVTRNNEVIIERILELRRAQVKLLELKTDDGKPISNWAENQLSSRMAKDPETALKVLEDTLEKARPAAAQEMEYLFKFAKENGFEGSALEHWDVSFYSEKMKKALYDYGEQELKQYFRYEEVKKGLWKLAERVFRVSVVEVLEEEQKTLGVQTWHKDVDFYKIVDLETRKLISYFFLDSPERDQKNGGAWFGYISGHTDNKVFIETLEEELKVPIGLIACNAPPATSEQPSLLTHRDVEVLAHEFGHSLQHMLTKEKIVSVAGIAGIELDAIEFPSQFMENWAWNRQTVDGMAAHWKSKNKIDDQLWANVVASKNFMEGTRLLRQLRFGMTDIYIHSDRPENEGKTAIEMEQDILKSTVILKPLENDRRLCSLEHIFAMGYSAGYYSYIWAEIMSLDAWEAFEEALDAGDEKEVERLGMLFRDTVLSLGGGVPPAEVFELFRGRAPKTEPFLRAKGLLPKL